MTDPARARPLRVVSVIDEATGEVVGQHAERLEQGEIEALKAQIADQARTIIGLERDVKAAHIRYQKLVEDKAAEAREHYLWPVIGMVFIGWQKRCKHPNAAFTSVRFWAAEPYFRSTVYGKTLELRVRHACTAIAGAAYDSFTKRAKNGRLMRYDDWEDNIFGGNGRYERMINRAPIGFEPSLTPKLQDAIRVAEGRARQIAARKQAGL